MILNDPDFTFTFVLVAMVFSVSVVTALIVGIVSKFSLLRGVVAATLVVLVTSVAGGIGYYVDRSTYEIDAILEIEDSYDVELYSMSGERLAGSQADVDIFASEQTDVMFVYEQTRFEGASLIQEQTDSGNTRFTLMVEVLERDGTMRAQEFSAQNREPLDEIEPGELLEMD